MVIMILNLTLGGAVEIFKMRRPLVSKQAVCRQPCTGDRPTKETTGTFLNKIQFLFMGNEEKRDNMD